MGKLHELLAVRQDRRQEANKAIATATNLFKNHPDRFRGLVVKFLPNEEEANVVVESTRAMAHTVRQVLDDVVFKWANALNVEGSIDSTNAGGSLARADLDEGEDELLKDLPAMFLLNLEKDLGQILNLIDAIPILDPTKQWEKDEDTGLHKHTSRKNRTRKQQVPIVLYQATPEHPAQTQMITEDTIIGEVEQIDLSGEYTLVQKDQLRHRCLDLIAEVKAARARANQAEHEDEAYGTGIRKLLFG